MALNKDTVLKLVQLLADIQEPHPVISRNTVVCLNNQDLNQPDRWLINSLQANSQVSKEVMVPHLLNLQLSTKINQWATELLPVLVVTAAVLSRLPMLNGVPQLPKALETDSAAIKDDTGPSLPPLRRMGFFTLHDFSRICGILILGTFS
jgi:hypothetical protein